MERDKIGAILKSRIKEKGYTQEKFAEEVGVKHSTLKKYMYGKSTYSYELLLRFAEKLECSVDYLLGQSKSPIREHHEIAEQTRLSEKAIQKIVKYARHYDYNFEAKRYIKCLDLLICEDGAFPSLCDYLYASKSMQKYIESLINPMEMAILESPQIKEIDVPEDRKLSLETQYMNALLLAMKNLKNEVSEILIAELKELDILPSNPWGL